MGLAAGLKSNPAVSFMPRVLERMFGGMNLAWAPDQFLIGLDNN